MPGDDGHGRRSGDRTRRAHERDARVEELVAEAVVPVLAVAHHVPLTRVVRDAHRPARLGAQRARDQPAARPFLARFENRRLTRRRQATASCTDARSTAPAGRTGPAGGSRRLAVQRPDEELAQVGAALRHKWLRVHTGCLELSRFGGQVTLEVRNAVAERTVLLTEPAGQASAGQ